jgi:O-antigen/teichoic acid export membrane protein
MNKPITILLNLAGFGGGHERSKRAQKNIVSSFVLKGLSIALGLISMPLTINYLEPQKYGIWVTLSSLIAWFSFFDIGLGGGLRNKFAIALAHGKHELARTYVSTTYAILSIIIVVILLLFYVVTPFLNWNSILNVGLDVVSGKELKLLAIIAFTSFGLNFVLKLVTTILTADQRPALASIFDLIGKAITVLVIIILVKTTSGSLIYLGIVYSTIPVLVLLTSSVWFFSGKYKKYRPSLKYVEFSKARDLLSIGLKFFVLGIAVLLLYQTNNIVIAQLFGPKEVTPYNVAFNYYNVLMMGFSIIITPFWSAFTEAWVKNEKLWIKNIMRKLFFIWGLLVVGGVLMVTFSQWIFSVWIGNKVHVPYMMSILVCSWILINAWNGIYSHFLNGVGKLKLQMICGISGALLNVPLVIYLGKSVGIEGVLLANIIISLPAIIIYPIQFRKIMNSNANGIWSK